MASIAPKPLTEYPWYLRLFFRRQARKYGRTLSPSWLWGRLPGLFGGLLVLLWLFQRRRFPVGTALRSLVSARVAQLNGCAFCVDLNAYNLLQAEGSPAKAAAVDHWRDSPLFTPKERDALDYAEAMTDTSRRAHRSPDRGAAAALRRRRHRRPHRLDRIPEPQRQVQRGPRRRGERAVPAGPGPRRA